MNRRRALWYLRLRRLLGYFFQGLLIAVPSYLSFLTIIKSLAWIDSIIPLDDYPGLGLFILVSSCTLLGYIGNQLFAQPFFEWLDDLISKLPLVGFVYSGVKDLMEAFVGKNKTFQKPVLVTVNPETGFQKIGFITSDDLRFIGIKDKVAVYFPHSYNFSGELFIISTQFISPINAPSAEMMKFVVSGGMAKPNTTNQTS
ncbi:MAG: DUF502 domain-containing protein [Bacteroidia bacterium]|nr:DUF502 domain-containing protein [Bacteroidia bacterium]